MRNPIRSHMAATIRAMFSLPNTTRYQELRRAAMEAAGRNNAALWFIEPDRSNVFVNSDGSGGAPTTGELVGLVLSPGRTPGAELFTGGDGSALGTWQGSNGTVTLDNGEFRLNTSAAYGGASRVISTVAGRWYECTATYRSGLGNGCNIYLRPGGSDVTTDQVLFPTNTSSTPITATRYIRATGTQLWVRLTSLLNAGSDVCYFDNLSFREVGGFTLESPTTAQKPSIVGSPSGVGFGFKFDGTDDRLRSFRTPLAAALDSSYTLIAAAEQSAVISGNAGRMVLGDARGITLNGNASQLVESLHGGTGRSEFPIGWPQGTRRVVTSIWNGATGWVAQRRAGEQVRTATLAAPAEYVSEMTIGHRFRSQTGHIEFWQGDIFLACAAPSVMPTADIQAIERFAGFIGGATVA